MKRIGWVAGGIGVLLLLAGAAFVGGQLLNVRGSATASGNGPMVSLSGPGGSGARTSVKLDIQPAPELPTTPADARGIFQRRQDSSIFVGTGQVSLMARKSQDGAISMTSNYDGPVVEIVLTHDTTLYRDATMKQFDGPPAPGQKLQQVLEPGSIDDIGENSMVVVWGDKRGERIVARVLTYSPPAFFRKGP